MARQTLSPETPEALQAREYAEDQRYAVDHLHLDSDQANQWATQKTQWRSNEAAFEKDQATKLDAARAAYQDLIGGKVSDTTDGVNVPMADKADVLENNLKKLGRDHTAIVNAPSDAQAIKTILDNIQKAYPGRDLSILSDILAPLPNNPTQYDAFDPTITGKWSAQYAGYQRDTEVEQQLKGSDCVKAHDVLNATPEGKAMLRNYEQTCKAMGITPPDLYIDTDDAGKETGAESGLTKEGKGFIIINQAFMALPLPDQSWVIGHECGHIIDKDNAAQNLANSHNASIGTSGVLDLDKANALSRTREYAADAQAFRKLHDPKVGIDFMELVRSQELKDYSTIHTNATMQDYESDAFGPKDDQQDHPSWSDRIKAIQAIMQPNLVASVPASTNAPAGAPLPTPLGQTSAKPQKSLP